MACFYPLTAFYGREFHASGKRKLVFKAQQAYPPLSGKPIKLPCGACTGCRLERSRQWAIRCTHEAQLHKANSFITLTYNNEHLPKDGSLKIRDFQLFIKRLRKKHGKVRYYHCGEYGEKLGRPHYHACLFGHDWIDKIPFKENKNGDMLYTSKRLDDLWTDPISGEALGFCTTGDVTFQSAAYCARYIMKKINGDQSEKHYERMDPETGEFFQIQPEYTTMSRRPGIGHHWLKSFPGDLFPDDFVVLKGKKHRVPRYYDNQYELTNPSEFAVIKELRVANAKKHEANNTPDRLRVREKIQEARLNKLPRNLKG